jgi:uncharacterized protein involved in tolerance to divalent cations
MTMNRVCCYCKDTIYHDYFNHLAACDGIPRQQVMYRRAELVEERIEVERQIKVLTDRKAQIQLQIDELDQQLPGQTKLII